MCDFIEPRQVKPVTAYSNGLIVGAISLLEEYCFEGKAKTDGELDAAIRLFVLESAYGQSVDIDVDEVVDSIYEALDNFMIKFNNNKK